MTVNNKVSMFVTLFLFITLFSYGESIVCYQCNSAFDPRCGDPFDPYTLGTVNCSFQPHPEHLSNIEPTICRKVSQTTEGKTRVVRGCGYVTDESKDDKACARRTGTHNVVAHYCSCTGDLCNDANTKISNHGIYGLFSILIILLVN